MNQGFLDVDRILGENGRSIKRRTGEELILDCWFCQPQDTGGHLYFHRDTGQYFCQKCGAKGNLQSLGWATGSGRSAGDSATPSTRDQIFRDAAKYYHDQLPDDLWDYWRGRGLSDEAITKRQLGYAQGGLRRHLLAKGYGTAEVVATRLVKRNGMDFFLRRLTIPYLQTNRVVTIRGRQHPSDANDGPKFIGLPEQPTLIFNLDSLRRHTDFVLICEGEPDTMIAAQLGFTAVGIPGAAGFKQEWAKLFPHSTPIAVILDPDDAGEKGASRIVSVIGPLIRVVTLPSGYDLNAYILDGHNAEQVRDLIHATSPWLESEISRVATLSEPSRTTRLRELFGDIAKLDRLQKPEYERQVKKAFSLSIEAVRGEVHDAAESQRVTETSDLHDRPTMSDSETAEAETLLKDERLIERFLEDSSRIGLVGEDDNKLTLLLAFTSRVSDSPINITVKGESSGGKSYLVGKVAQFIPPEDIKELTALSPRALYHWKDSLSHKILIIYERHGSEDADYSVRSLQSEGKLVFAMPIKNAETGRFETEEVEVEGPVGFVETTTKSHVHPENATRCFDLYIDDSSLQTLEVFAEQRRRYRGEVVDTNAVVRPWRNAQRLLRPYPILIPFVDLIRFPDRPIRVRRDHQRFLTLIEAVCLIHQRQREVRVIDGTEYLVATADDYAIAHELAGKVLLQTLKNLSPSAEEFLGKVLEFVSKTDGAPDTNRELTVSQMEMFSGLSNSTTSRLLKECAVAGYLDRKDVGRGRAAKYRFLSEPKVPDTILLAPSELERQITEAELRQVRQSSSNGFDEVTAIANNDLR